MATLRSPLPSPELLVSLADDPTVSGIAVVGSVARGDASEWSDIDIEAMVADPAAKWDARPSFLGCRLVMRHPITPAEQWRQLGLPDKAIWAAPPDAAMLIRADRDGGLAKLRAACRSFDYSTLGPAATLYLRQKATATCEYVFKIRDALGTRDEPKVLHAAAGLTARCARLVAVAFLTPIRTENEYYRVVQDAAGPTWTAAHRAAFGLPGGDAFAQAVASCTLFRETMRLVDDRLDGASRAIVGPTLPIAP